MGGGIGGFDGFYTDPKFGESVVHNLLYWYNFRGPGRDIISLYVILHNSDMDGFNRGTRVCTETFLPIPVCTVIFRVLYNKGSKFFPPPPSFYFFPNRSIISLRNIYIRPPTTQLYSNHPPKTLYQLIWFEHFGRRCLQIPPQMVVLKYIFIFNKIHHLFLLINLYSCFEVFILNHF